ncbi:MAG TPA: BON domain-containing protein [Chloroflexota bacterium]|nr:BON domain-containing protein [Chloroflexota bacterium]
MEEEIVMNYGYGPAFAGPSFSPYWLPGWYGGAGIPFAWYGAPPYAPPMVFPSIAYTWTRPNDAEIKYYVETALSNDPEIPPHANISVDVSNAVVTLTGTVPNKRIKHAAGDDAWYIPWVVDVHNEIEVVPRRERAAGAGEGTMTAGRRGEAAVR